MIINTFAKNLSINLSYLKNALKSTRFKIKFNLSQSDSKRRVGRGTKPTIHKNVGCSSYPP